MLDKEVMTTHHLREAVLGIPGSLDLKEYLDAFYKSFKDKNIDISEDRFDLSSGAGLIAHAIFDYGSGNVSLEEARDILWTRLDCVYLLSNIIECKYVHYVDIYTLNRTLSNITFINEHTTLLNAPLMYTPFNHRHLPLTYSEKDTALLFMCFYHLASELGYTNVTIRKSTSLTNNLPFFTALSAAFKIYPTPDCSKHSIALGAYDKDKIMVAGDTLIDALGFGINRLAYELESQTKD